MLSAAANVAPTAAISGRRNVVDAAGRESLTSEEVDVAQEEEEDDEDGWSSGVVEVGEEEESSEEEEEECDDLLSSSCDACPYLAPSQEALFVHQVVHRDLAFRQWPHRKGWSMAENDAIQRMERLQGGGGGTVFRCSLCKRTFSNRYNAKRHYRNFHEDEDDGLASPSSSSSSSSTSSSPSSLSSPICHCPFCGWTPGPGSLSSSSSSSSVFWEVRRHIHDEHTLSTSVASPGDDSKRFRCFSCAFAHHFVGVVRTHEDLVHPGERRRRSRTAYYV